MTKQDLESMEYKEGNFKVFKHAGLFCCIVRYHGNLNGYVGVPKTHPAYGVNYTTYCDQKPSKIEKKINNIKVHGGLTYSRNELFGWELDKLWWFGFDTAHAGDLAVWNIDFMGKFPDYTYKDMDYVRKQTQKLAGQLARIK